MGDNLKMWVKLWGKIIEKEGDIMSQNKQITSLENSNSAVKTFPKEDTVTTKK